MTTDHGYRILGLHVTGIWTAWYTDPPVEAKRSWLDGLAGYYQSWPVRGKAALYFDGAKIADLTDIKIRDHR